MTAREDRGKGSTGDLSDSGSSYVCDVAFWSMRQIDGAADRLRTQHASSMPRGKKTGG